MEVHRSLLFTVYYFPESHCSLLTNWRFYVLGGGTCYYGPRSCSAGAACFYTLRVYATAPWLHSVCAVLALLILSPSLPSESCPSRMFLVHICSIHSSSHYNVHLVHLHACLYTYCGGNILNNISTWFNVIYPVKTEDYCVILILFHAPKVWLHRENLFWKAKKQNFLVKWR